MSCRRALVAACLLRLALPAPAGAAEVRIVSPAAQPAFGEVEFAVEVIGIPGVLRVELRVDGRVAASPAAPPYRARVDVGHDNREHRFEASVITAAGIAARQALVTPAIQVDQELDVSLRQLYVTVTRGEERVRGLGRRDLRIFDNGREQEIVTFEGGDAPFTSVLLVDASESMFGGRLAVALSGAQGFARGMRPLDETSLILFSDRIRRSIPFTDAADPILAGLADSEAAGGTALNDHLYLALQLLDGRQGRRVVVLFSDGADVMSALRMREVLWKAQRSQAAIYWIRLQQGNTAPRFHSAWRDADGNAREEELLEQAVRESGGRVASLSSLDDVEAAYQGVLDELRSQYVLGYYPSGARHDGSWREVEVRAAGGASARTREGYLDY